MKINKNKIKKIKEKREEEFNNAQLILDQAQKEKRIKKLEEENANLFLEIAQLKAGR